VRILHLLALVNMTASRLARRLAQECHVSINKAAHVLRTIQRAGELRLWLHGRFTFPKLFVLKFEDSISYRLNGRWHLRRRDGLRLLAKVSKNVRIAVADAIDDEQA